MSTGEKPEVNTSISASFKIPALEKFMDIVNNLGGRAFSLVFGRKEADIEMYRKMREADAEGYKLKLLAQAKMDAELCYPEIGNSVESNFAREAQINTYIENVDRKLNLASVLAETEDQMKLTNEPLEAEVNEDSIKRIFKYAEEVSTEELHVLWAKILSGEIKQPGLQSLALLDFVKNLTKNDAEIINKLAPFVFFINLDEAIIPIPNLKNKRRPNVIVLKHNIDTLNRFEITRTDLDILEELGLIKPISSNSLTIEATPSEIIFTKKHKLGSLGFILEIPEGVTAKLPCIILTRLGRELMKLIEAELNNEFLKEIQKSLLSYGINVGVAQLIPAQRADEYLIVPVQGFDPLMTYQG